MELLNAIARNDLRRFTELLDSGVDPNTVFNPEDGVYINPLINAVYFLRPQMFTILLERGANPYHADGLGSTAFDYIRILRRGMPLLGGEIAPLSDTQRRKLNLIAYTLSEWERQGQIKKEIFSRLFVLRVSTINFTDAHAAQSLSSIPLFLTSLIIP